MTLPDQPVSGTAPSHGLPRQRRLRKASEFSTVYRRGRASSGPRLVIKALPNRSGAVRFGFAVGKKVGNAVARNLVKRRLREIVRQELVVPGMDVIVIAKPASRDASYQQLRAETQSLLARGRITTVPGRR